MNTAIGLRYLLNQVTVIGTVFGVRRNFSTPLFNQATMGDVKTLIKKRIAGKKVVIISKAYCPFCVRAKRIFQDYMAKGVLFQDDYDVMEIENDPNCEQIQQLMQEITGDRSVPRVFINGEFIGGCDETSKLERQGKLKPLLS